ncbi:hypothetical protein [Paenibacillus sinopodophylli]|uniref:hypothetical protein n=1 Tax=Paenibacillus sinopodophylli TaxID=1837342 RepID=UPI00110CDA49|nr:hypothetical protein [Paenibacillus sinopodophylli]
MAKIIAPNVQYNGLSASVNFINGIGLTNDPHLIEWFENQGYTIEDDEAEVDKAAEAAKKEVEKQLKALRKKATELGIEGVADKDSDTLTAEIAVAEQK